MLDPLSKEEEEEEEGSEWILFGLSELVSA